MKTFISYSHKDEAYLERLHTHLATLRREVDLLVWFDREILAGDPLDEKIIDQLDECDLFIALVSPDFLNSNYCYEKEMQYALEKHASGKTRVVPIILEPCDWTSTPLGNLKALPKDGKPIAEWQNQNTAFLDVIKGLRRVLSPTPRTNDTATLPNADTGSTGSSRYRIKKTFDEIDRQDFRQQMYKEIRDYIATSIKEIDAIEDIKARFSDITTTSFTCSILNKSRDRSIGYITVHSGKQPYGTDDIYYSFSENASPNTSNGGFSIEADDYELFLKGRFMPRLNNNERVTAQQAAKIIWDELLEKAGISYAGE